MPREIRYWNSRSFHRVYGRDASAKGFPRRDGEGCYLTMGYRIRLDDGLPEDGEPSPHPSGRPAPATGLARGESRDRATPRKATPRQTPGVSFRHFEHSGGYDGFEGRMACPPDTAGPKGGPC